MKLRRWHFLALALVLALLKGDGPSYTKVVKVTNLYSSDESVGLTLLRNGRPVPEGSAFGPNDTMSMRIVRL